VHKIQQIPKLTVSAATMTKAWCSGLGFTFKVTCEMMPQRAHRADVQLAKVIAATFLQRARLPSSPGPRH